jgi:Tol biopolymer transport system component
VITRFSIPLANDQEFTNPGRQMVAISPDGTQVVYLANQRLFRRSMSEPEATPIAGAESPGDVATSPVFSPDGRSIAFWSGADRMLKRVPVGGGRAATICPADRNPFGMSWGPDGIVFGQGKDVLRVASGGGPPKQILSVKADQIAYGPQTLPDNRGMLLTLSSESVNRMDKPRIVLQTPGASELRTLMANGTDARYLPTGHIVFARGGTLYAVSFDLRRLEVTSEPAPVLEGVAQSSAPTGATHFSVSDTGSLVYVPEPSSAFPSRPTFSFALLDRTGNIEQLKLEPGPYDRPRVSPDGKHIAFGQDDDKGTNIWIYDLSETGAKRQLTLGGRNRFPVWSSDGQYVAFQSDREGDLAIFRQRSDSSGTATRLTKPEAGTSHVPESWSPRDDVLSFSVRNESRFSLRTYSLRDRVSASFGGVESAIPADSVFSPNGRWLAYQIGEIGKPTIFVQPYPATGEVHQVSNPELGLRPLWSPDGNEILYAIPAGGRPTGDGWVAVRITLSPTYVLGRAEQQPGGGFAFLGPLAWRNHDITPNGKRLGLIRVDNPRASFATIRQIDVVVNWTEELKQRVPPKR